MTQDDILEMARSAGLTDSIELQHEIDAVMRFAELIAISEREAQKQQQINKRVGQNWQSELLDLVSACQSAYHIDNTEGHRFGGIGSNLEDNRFLVVEFVSDLLVLAARERQANYVAWKHDCNALLIGDLELWVENCPHCGKPRPV